MKKDSFTSIGCSSESLRSPLDALIELIERVRAQQESPIDVLTFTIADYSSLYSSELTLNGNSSSVTLCSSWLVCLCLLLVSKHMTLLQDAPF